jgi:hypothetical protein
MSVGILVPSYDGYSDLWPIAAELFKRFWPDRTYPMYWMTNGKEVPTIAKPIVRPSVDRKEWGRYVASALNRMHEPFVLFWVEEIFLLSTVPNDIVMEAEEILKDNPDVGIVQLNRYYWRPSAREATVGNFADSKRGNPEFSAALPAIFRKEVLRHLLNTLPMSNDFEQQSALVMASHFPKVRSLAPCVPMFKFCDNALVAGPWRKCAMKHMSDMGFDIDFSIRGIFPDDCKHMDGVPA